MKITTTLKNNKADNAKKKSALLAAHNKIVHYNGNIYRIIIAKIGSLVLANAEAIKGVNVPLINLFDKSTAAKELKKLVENGLVS